MLVSWSSTYPIPWEMSWTFLSDSLTQNEKRKGKIEELKFLARNMIKSPELGWGWGT